MKSLQAVDLFCGAGGTSSGILKACERLSQRPIKLTAVNHWKTAINTHSLNHPGVHHICEPVENLHPLDLVKSGHLDLLAASCECRFHSNARGGGPCNEQSRAQPWQLIRWATDINVENILMENVREFQNWGPLNKRTKKPIPGKRGKFFRAFLNALENLGYQVEFRIQCAADFGDATSRLRLILMARKSGAVQWPDPSHGPLGAAPWRTARGILDWSLKGRSIAERPVPYCRNTIERMAAGLRKFGGANAEPFLVILNGTTKKHLEASAKTLDEPLPPVVTGTNHFVLCEPFLVKYHGNHAGRDDGNKRVKSVDEPLATIDTSNRFCLVEPFIVQTDQTGGNGPCIQPLDEPLKTIVTKQNMILVEPFIVKFYGSGVCVSVDEPLDTVTTRDRFMLVEPQSGRSVAEIGLRTRMLQPHELAAAHSFPTGYKFTGTKQDQTKQIGNSVPVELAAAHARVLLA